MPSSSNTKLRWACSCQQPAPMSSATADQWRIGTGDGFRLRRHFHLMTCFVTKSKLRDLPFKAQRIPRIAALHDYCSSARQEWRVGGTAGCLCGSATGGQRDAGCRRCKSRDQSAQRQIMNLRDASAPPPLSLRPPDLLHWTLGAPSTLFIALFRRTIFRHLTLQLQRASTLGG